MTQIKDANLTMDELIAQGVDYDTPALGSLIKGQVIVKTKNKILVDLNGVSVGIISGKETHDSQNTIKEIQDGDEIYAVVVEEENEDGMMVLSLRKASQQRAWDRFLKAFNEGEIIEVVAQEVNKGGLLLEVDGIKGFIPVSQLAPLHYPRVNNANTSEIVSRLQKLIGVKFHVKIINVDQENGKLILSEKEAMTEERHSALKKLKVGQKIKGKISGVVKFGVFVTFEGLEGLVHISEIAWGHVKDTNEYGRVGDEVEVLVIGVDGEKISLSMKRLMEDPWIKIAKMFEVGKIVKGVVNRITPFGAFMKLSDDINGLIHLSEISHQKVDDPHKFISIGEEVEAKVITVDLDEHRIGLSVKAMHPIDETAKKTEEETKEPSKEKKGKDDNKVKVSVVKEIAAKKEEEEETKNSVKKKEEKKEEKETKVKKDIKKVEKKEEKEVEKTKKPAPKKVGKKATSKKK
jgi:ribosomal protein S1